MAARYLKSLSTGVVLPYVEATLLNAKVREMTPAECEEYEASIGVSNSPPPAPEPVAEPEPVAAPAAVEKGVTVTRDISEGEPDVDAVIAALEVD